MTTTSTTALTLLTVFSTNPPTSTRPLVIYHHIRPNRIHTYLTCHTVTLLTIFPIETSTSDVDKASEAPTHNPTTTCDMVSNQSRPITWSPSTRPSIAPPAPDHTRTHFISFPFFSRPTVRPYLTSGFAIPPVVVTVPIGWGGGFGMHMVMLDTLGGLTGNPAIADQPSTSTKT